LQACAGRTDAVFEAELGWPMSGDYMALADAVQPLQREVEQIRAVADQARLSSDAALGAAQAQIGELEKRHQELELRRHELDLRRHDLDMRRLELERQLQAMSERNERSVEERNLIARHRLVLQGELATLAKNYQGLSDHLRWIEHSTVFRMTRPLVHAKMAVQRMLGLRAVDAPALRPAPQPATPRVVTVDVIVPVYRGLADTQLCVRSVLASQCRTPYRLVILNDASPEPEVTQWLREVSREEPRIVLLENQENLGFVATVNRGMALDDKHDVLLLNSDTEVANDWLDRLRGAAYSDQRVASVTPFSNNATICSYPRFVEPNELPEGWGTAALDALFARVNAGQVVDVPTGVGFCMYIRRDSLDEVGLFDVAKFGKGYGEENDFCRRAAEAGWRNLHSLDTFVLHTGGVSFGASKSQREIEAVEKLRVLHPDYDRLVHAFVVADPARTARLAVDLARAGAAGLPGVLAVVHDRGGGTRRHVDELAHYLLDRAVFFSLTPAPGGTVWLERVEPGAGFRLEFALPSELPALQQALRAIGIAHVHYHHVLGHRDEVLGLGDQLGLQWDFTAHDYYTMCPQISLTDSNDRYCGEEGDGQCGRCLKGTPAPGGADIASWRERYGVFLARARHVLAPSRDTARRIARMWPSVDVRFAPHTDLVSLAQLPQPRPRPLARDAPLKVAVIGALSRIKGADLLEDVATLAAKGHVPVEFHLMGHAYRELRKQPRASLAVHGAYQESDLPGLLDWIKPDLVWFPALWPETYSYTLSACLEAGLPVVAPDIGAFPERLSGRPWSWVRPWDDPAAQLLAFFCEVRERNFIPAQAPAPQWQVAPAAGDASIGSWSYDSDYLRNVKSPEAPATLDPDFLKTHGHSRAVGAQAQRRMLQQWTLNALVRLRSAPALRQLARAIPLRWQTRVKSWLRA
ncbi:MAG: glycosyltransferase, partial [Ramlibacter sp.]